MTLNKYISQEVCLFCTVIQPHVGVVTSTIHEDDDARDQLSDIFFLQSRFFKRESKSRMFSSVPLQQWSSQPTSGAPS